MIIFYPIFASLLNVVSILSEKVLFARKRVQYKLFVSLGFFIVFAITIMVYFIFPGWWQIDAKAFGALFLVLLVITAIIGGARNILFYYGLTREGLSEIEPFVAFAPLLTVVFASIIYPDERNTTILVLALVAALALIFTHVERRHLVLDKGLVPIAGAVLLEAIENNLFKELLTAYSPLALYCVRSGVVALFLFAVFRPKMQEAKKKDVAKITLISFLWVAIMLLFYSSYQQLGVVYTSLVLMTSPVLIVLSSRVILKEKKIRKRDMIGLAIVVLCVVAAQFVTR